MCLGFVSQEKPNPTGFGWKVFRVIANAAGGRKYRQQRKLYSENRGQRQYEYNKWYQATTPDNFPGRQLSTSRKAQEGVDYDKRQKYTCGFHIALSRQDARNFVKGRYGHSNLVVRKIEYRGAHTAGTGAAFFPGKQVIAEEIRILPETRPKRAKKTVAGIPGTQKEVAGS